MGLAYLVCHNGETYFRAATPRPCAGSPASSKLHNAQMLARALLILVTLFVVVIYYVPIGHVDFAESWGEGTFGIALPSQRMIVSGLSRVRAQIARECAPAIVWSRER